MLFLANLIRSDICFAVNYVARFQTDPKDVHWKLVKHIFRYIARTVDYRNKYNKTNENKLEIYVDTDYKDDPTTRRSTIGYLINYKGNIIHWRSHLQ